MQISDKSCLGILLIAIASTHNKLSMVNMPDHYVWNMPSVKYDCLTNVVIPDTVLTRKLDFIESDKRTYDTRNDLKFSFLQDPLNSMLETEISPTCVYLLDKLMISHLWC